MARELFAVRGELSMSGGLLLNGSHEHGEEMLTITSNLGLTKCRRRAQDTIWWPGITVDVKKKIEACAHCSIHKPSQRREPLQTTPLPDHGRELQPIYAS